MKYHSKEAVKRLSRGLVIVSVLYLACLGLPASAIAAAPDTLSAKPDSSWRNQAPKLYLLDRTGADTAAIISEVTFVNYVRDSGAADIDLTITDSATAGSREYAFSFQGRGSFKDIGFVLRHTAPDSAPATETQAAVVAAIKSGLSPFIARTGLRDNLAVGFTPPTAVTTVSDPWRNWVFTLGLTGNAQGNASWTSLYYAPTADISRVTDLAKFDLTGGGSSTRNRYVLDSSTVETMTRTTNAECSYARKLSEHFAVQGDLEYSSSDYSNIRLSLQASPRLEYSIRPYSEHAQHKVYLRFLPAVVYSNYYDTTVYLKLSDRLLQNAVAAGITATRSWGTVDLSATGSHYLYDFSKNHLTLSGNASLRIVAGLSLTASGSYEFVHDQLSLRKDWATEEERILRLRELQTGYTYTASLTLNYTFGSTCNNIVNPIF